MNAELTLPPELVNEIADKVIEKLKSILISENNKNSGDKYLTVKQLSEYTGYSCSWIYNNKNKIPHFNDNKDK